MTAAPTASMPLYDDLGALYTRDLTHHGIQTAMLTHKWQRSDLLAPHSDLDIRVLLDEPPADWLEWNHRLAAAHSAAVNRSPSNRRLLEHPPGFAFTLSEVHRRRVSPPELATWTLIHGHAPTLQRWKSHTQMAPWSRTDERFYRAILDARLDGRYQLSADSTDYVTADLPGYRRHCIAWHYLAPCWFAAAALATRTRCPGKSAALRQWRPSGLERYAERFLHYVHIDQAGTAGRAPAIRDMLRAADRAVNAAMRHIPTPEASEELAEAEDSRAVAWTMTAAMLRVRVARWLYYLDPPPGVVTEYLIAREAKELRAAAEVLHSMATEAITPEQRLATHMIRLLPTSPTTPAVLCEALISWNRDRALVEDLLTLHST
ncbi:hypothetical protein [Streptomyces malaysiensis]|nr:hypothetical protein [Streptomyces malaysiensis]